jgi:hypothetical protein
VKRFRLKKAQQRNFHSWQADPCRWGTQTGRGIEENIVFTRLGSNGFPDCFVEDFQPVRGLRVGQLAAGHALRVR